MTEPGAEKTLAAQGWTRRVSACGGCVAVLKGPEIHVEFTRERVVRRQAVREFLEPLMDELGFLTTRTYAGDEATQRFLSRLGFKKTWEDRVFSYYILTALPFSKGK